jgi:beta-lactam-binding protein with PASTA domain
VTAPPPPPPPRDPGVPDPVDPTLVEAPGRRVVVDEGPPPPIVRPYPWWLWLLSALFLAVAVVFAVLWYTQRNGGADVPDLGGLRQAEAQDRAAARGFTLKVVFRPAARPAGVVVDQAPQPGADLEDGAQIMAVVSRGRQQVTVPRLVGVKLEAAQQLLTDLELQPSTETVRSTKPKGTVVTQDPKDGTTVPRGSTVTLGVSSGTGRVAVPALRDTSQSDAVAAIVDAGLVPVVIQIPSREPEGTVIAQDPAPNEQVPIGSRVRVNVSGGPANTSTQTLTVTTSRTTTQTSTRTTATTVTTATP